MRYLLLASAALLAATSAYFSVIGLSKIFIGIFAPFIILELGKFVAAIYLHSQWDHINKIIKAYMVSAVVVLMVMTSSGIFGYLSGAAMTHTTSSKTESDRIGYIDTQITQKQTRQSQLTNDRRRLDGFVDKASTSAINESQGVATYNRQKAARKAIDDELNGISKAIDDLQKEKQAINEKFLTVQHEVGPALYLAKSLYGNDSVGSIESAIRVVIYLIVFTFDPLAVVLLIAAQHLFEKPNPIEKKRPRKRKATKRVMVKSVKSKNDVGDIVISEAPEPSDELSISDDEKAEISERNRRVIETAKSKLQKRVDTLTRRVQ
jgi:hypothetical protein